MPHAASAMDEKSAVTGSQSKLPGEKSTTPSISSGFAKRSIGEVIDLTFSSDEEDEPPRPPKRQLKTSLSGSLLRFPRSENTRPHLSEGNLGDPKPAKTISTPNFLCQNLIGPS